MTKKRLVAACLSAMLACFCAQAKASTGETLRIGKISPTILGRINRQVETRAATPVETSPSPLHSVVTATASPTPVPTVAPSPEPSSAAVETGAPEIKSGQLYHVKLGQSEEVALQKAIQGSTSGTGGGDGPSPVTVSTVPGIVKVVATNGQELRLKPFVAGEAMAFDRGRKLYVGKVQIGVIDLQNAASGLRLSAPIRFQFIEASSARPDVLTVRTTGQPFVEAEVVRKNVPGPVTVHLSSSLDVPGTPVTLPLEPELRLRIDRPSIQGFGLEDAHVTVLLTGIPNPRDYVVTLGSDRSAYFEPSDVKLNENGIGTSVLRSDSVGPLQITATTNGFPEVSRPITFRWPWELVTAALLGGLIGALIRLLGTKKLNWRPLVGSTLFGLVVFALYAVGVNILPIAPTVPVGAALTFAVSAFGSLIGPSLVAGFRRAPE